MPNFNFLDNLQGKLQDYFAPNEALAAPNSALPPQIPSAPPDVGVPQAPVTADTGNLSSFLQQPGQMPSPQDDQDGLQQEIMRLGTIQYLKDLLKSLKGGEGGQSGSGLPSNNGI